MNMNILLGRNPVLEALKSERDINKILIAEGHKRDQMQQVIAISKRKKVYCSICTKEKN